MTLLEIARQYGFIKEKTGHNDGLWVELILWYVGLKRGDPWCAAWVSFILGSYTKGKPPFRTGSCEAIHQWAKDNNRIVTVPQPGDVFLLLVGPGNKEWPEDHAHHTGFVTSNIHEGTFATIEGNTNPGGGRDGYGVFERERHAGKYTIFVRPII
jgi:hypothetical protein